MNSKGMTLVEMIVTVSIIGILVTLATVNYSSIRRKAMVENDAKRIYALSNKARQFSFTWKDTLKLNIASGEASVVYADNGNVASGLNAELDTTFAKNGDITFKDGFVVITGSVTTAGSDTGAEYDCVLFQASRIKLGKLDGGNCDIK
ncbi:type II secretion system protein [Limisalsivibrio acetivorans]|uniref:type II secretion system protein n=1 Tax=Limisalsivibrio acetivorans TaxID=1304888 RepID=UPI0003B39129|nr:type II secretion system protein [Limisalsivibrio acetivorans]